MKLSYSAEQRARRRDHLKYYVDEFSILVVLIGSVLLSDPVEKWAKTRHVAMRDLYMDWLNILVACFIGVSLYGKIHTKWRYNDSAKPSWWTRASTAASYGVCWKTLSGWGLSALGVQ